MRYSKRFIKFFNRKNPVYFPDWLVEAWYKQFQVASLSFD